MKMLKLFWLKIWALGLLVACVTPRSEPQVIFTQEQMQRQYQEVQKINLLAAERKNKGHAHEYLEFKWAQDKFEDMKREKIPDFLFREIDVGSRLFKLMAETLQHGTPRLAEAQKNPDGTRKWAPYDWAYNYCYNHSSSWSGSFSYSFGTYAKAQEMGYKSKKVTFDPVPFVERAEKRGYVYYTLTMTPERPKEARMLQIFMFFDKEDRYQGYVFCTYL